MDSKEFSRQMREGTPALIESLRSIPRGFSAASLWWTGSSYYYAPPTPPVSDKELEQVKRKLQEGGRLHEESGSWVIKGPTMRDRRVTLETIATLKLNAWIEKGVTGWFLTEAGLRENYWKS